MEGPQELTGTLTDAQRQVRISATATPPVENAGPGRVVPGSLEETEVTVRPQRFAVGGSHVCVIENGFLYTSDARGYEIYGKARDLMMMTGLTSTSVFV